MYLPNFDFYQDDIYIPERLDLRIPYAYLKKFGSQKAVWLSTLIGHYFHFKGFCDDLYPEEDIGFDSQICFPWEEFFYPILKISEKTHNKILNYFKELEIIQVKTDETYEDLKYICINWPVLLEMFPELQAEWRASYLPSIDYYPSEDFLSLYQQPKSNQPKSEPENNGKIIDLNETRKNRNKTLV